MVGWQGVSLRTPPDWNLVGVGGDEKRGYLRVDGPSSMAVEIRWEAMNRVPDLDGRIDHVLDALEKAARKRKLGFSSRIKTRKPTPAEDRYGGESLGFTWKSDRNAYGRILYCGYCKRLVIAQVVCETKADTSGLSSQILGSICEHEEPGWNVWALYDLCVSVPEEFALTRHSLMSSFVELEFVTRSERLLIQRWGLAANTLLKKTSFDEWLEKSYAPGIRGYAIRTARAEGEDEEFAFHGRRKGLVRALVAPYKGLRGNPIPRAVSGRVWYCESSNRIYAVRYYHRGAGELAPVIREKMNCH